LNSNTLLTFSIIADVLDIAIIGQTPGIGHILDLPVFIMHFMAGGPKAAFTLLEAIPGIGFLPIFSWFAWKYHKTGRYGE
jgi:hypothetical protein